MNQEDWDYYMENEDELNDKLCGLTLDEIIDIEIKERCDF